MENVIQESTILEIKYDLVCGSTFPAEFPFTQREYFVLQVILYVTGEW